MNRTEQVLKALSSPIRREILWRVWDRELPVAAVADGLDVTAPTVSSHLTVLREAGLVEMRPAGTTRWYRANRDAVNALRALIPEDTAKWDQGSDFAEQALATSRLSTIVVVEVDVPCSPDSAFRAFTDGDVYSRWLRVPVSLIQGHFSCTMEWGIKVRGTYDAMYPPTLIVMNWDFEAAAIPVPGAGERANLFITPIDGGGTHLELQQFVESIDQARYMDRAWRLVLGRFKAGVLDALDPTVHIEMLAARPRTSNNSA